MTSRRRTMAVLVTAAAALAACADDGDGQTVALPGLDGAPLDVTIGPPPPPATTTTEPREEAATASETTSAPEPEPQATTTLAAAPTTAAAPEPAPTTTIGEDVFLRQGDEGPVVLSLQERLIAIEYLAPGNATGVFDGATADALIDFQGQYGLIVDGIFGPESDRALNAAVASIAE